MWLINVGAYSITDGDCDKKASINNAARKGRSVFHYRWGLRQQPSDSRSSKISVGAYSITDGDCDR